jgi:hypothetical protein
MDDPRREWSVTPLWPARSAVERREAARAVLAVQTRPRRGCAEISGPPSAGLSAGAPRSSRITWASTARMGNQCSSREEPGVAQRPPFPPPRHISGRSPPSRPCQLPASADAVVRFALGVPAGQWSMAVSATRSSAMVMRLCSQQWHWKAPTCRDPAPWRSRDIHSSSSAPVEGIGSCFR